MDEGDNESKDGVIWNFDDNEAKLIFDMKLRFIGFRDNWDLENAYWALLKLISEVEPLFIDKIREEINLDFDDISKTRKDIGGFVNIEEEEDKGIYFNLLNQLYRKICLDMVEENYYFRKKQKYTGL